MPYITKLKINSNVIITLFKYCIFYFLVLVMEPFGEMSLASCKVKLLQDWYTFFQVCLFYIRRIKEILNYIIMFVNAIEVKKNLFPYFIQQNPNPNYEETLHCTQEAVYPLYTMIFIFYALCGILMLLVRPLLSSKVIMM